MGNLKFTWVEVISATLSGVSSAGQFSAPRMDWQKIERSATVVVIPPLSCQSRKPGYQSDDHAIVPECQFSYMSM
eukprot:COSAG06_NODE_238_length_19422_cov_16.417741_26_plen_75_part_00